MRRGALHGTTWAMFGWTMATLLVGCGAARSPVEELTRIAAVDLSCMPENIDAEPLEGSFEGGEPPGSVAVDGCGRRALYRRDGLSYALVAPAGANPTERSLAMKASFDLECDPKEIRLRALEGGAFTSAHPPTKVHAGGCGKEATYDGTDGDFTREIELKEMPAAAD